MTYWSTQHHTRNMKNISDGSSNKCENTNSEPEFTSATFYRKKSIIWVSL